MVGTEKGATKLRAVTSWQAVISVAVEITVILAAQSMLWRRTGIYGNAVVNCLLALVDSEIGSWAQNHFGRVCRASTVAIVRNHI